MIDAWPIIGRGSSSYYVTYNYHRSRVYLRESLYVDEVLEPYTRYIPCGSAEGGRSLERGLKAVTGMQVDASTWWCPYTRPVVHWVRESTGALEPSRIVNVARQDSASMVYNKRGPLTKVVCSGL